MSASAVPRRRSNQRLIWVIKGTLMPPMPASPTTTACAKTRSQTPPAAESAKPAPIITAPNMTVQRTPMRSASQPMAMPPTPEPSQAKEPASAGSERELPSSAAMGLRATAVTRGAP